MMFDSLRRRFNTRKFSWLCRGIMDTPPIRHRPAPLRIVSMVRGDDLSMYLIAIKSFYRQLPGGSITVMDDGTLTEAHRALLRHHLGEPEIVRIDDIATGPCPSGSCWERLLFILDRTAESYVVQLDSDMLTTGPVPEVVAAIEGNRAFTLNSAPDQPIVDLETAARQVADHDARFMQIRAEQALPRLPPDAGRFYVRGSAGFAGFARGGPDRRAAEAFSTAMQDLLGPSWLEWGSEQISSNYIVCNSPDGLALPWPKYCCFIPGVQAEHAAMMHFIGTWRFQHGMYARKARGVVDAMLKDTAAR
ncbi:hypothetical protein AAFN86_06805 [Roseomonas sp. CAU 1739]|uniref:hypothetical protein n=1 Tax=Roseomonas sp. CAU 1739 TaxID=3140364 RepID=UPI00325B0497